MFRKPKNKSNLRQRKVSVDENEEEDEKEITERKMDDQLVSKKPPPLLSFDHDEGCDDNFEVKKKKKNLKSAKRLRHLEESIEVEIQQEIQREVKKEAEEPEPHPISSKHTEHEESVTNKFPSTFEGIPDSRAVYEAKKRRERLRKEGDFIPLDEDKKIRTKGERSRLIRDDDNDDSEEDTTTFYSSRLSKNQEESERRDEEMMFLEKENGDEDREVDEWERQQIAKVVGKNAINELRDQYNAQSQMYRGYSDLDNKEEVGMDIDPDEDILHLQSNDQSNVTVHHVLSKLKLRMMDREEVLNTKRHELHRMRSTMVENGEIVDALRMTMPTLADKYKVFQKVRAYSRSLLECLDEKVEQMNMLFDTRRSVYKARRERLVHRRRRDVKDCYEQLALVAAGRGVARSGEMATRAAERDARRARRRRLREGGLQGISHDEGLSSDDEETHSQQLADQDQIAKVRADLETIFADTHYEFSTYRIVLERVLEWLYLDEKSFEDAYVSLCLPRLSSPFVRSELAACDILNSSFRLDTCAWYQSALSVEGDHPVIVHLIPSIVDRVVLPFLIDVTVDEWDPFSLKQCIQLSTLLRTIINEYPSMTPKSKALRRLLDSIINAFQECVNEDLFIPMYSKQAIANAQWGCRAFLDRQFWSTIKVMRAINSFHGVLSNQMIAKLIFSVANKAVIAIQVGPMDDDSCVSKTRSLLKEMSGSIDFSDSAMTRSVETCLRRVIAEQQTRASGFCREILGALDRLEHTS